MKISIVAAIYPPVGTGGAEDCARSFARWAASHGHEVSVVTVANDPEHEKGFSDGTIDVTAIATGHVTPAARIHHSPTWKKLIWHPQDHLLRTTPRILARTVADQRPDVIMIHYLQGFGYRSIVELAKLRVPIVMVLHDLGLCCIRMSMFRRGATCARQCVACRISTDYKASLFHRAGSLTSVGFISPSRANLSRVGQYFPIHAFPREAILNTKTYPVAPPRVRTADGILRLLYAGRLEAAKGVTELADAVAALPGEVRIELTIAGHGLLEDELRERYASEPRIRLSGFVPQDQLSHLMREHDVLCIPSLWAENSPGVAIQAILNRLPMIANNRGGLPELIRDGVDGCIVEADTSEAWQRELLKLLSSKDQIKTWRLNLEEVQHRFDVDRIGHETIAFIERVRAAALLNDASLEDEF